MTKMSTARHTETGDPHVVEWLTGLFSAACVIAMIAWMGVQAIGQRDEAPDLSVSVGFTYNALLNNFGFTLEVLPNVVAMNRRGPGMFGRGLLR